jgi:hypothetical protein
MFRLKQNVVYTQNGRGNNWALGYSKDYLEVQSKTTYGFGDDRDQMTLHERVMEMVRKRAEQADYFRGAMLFHSLAGGTGSGLGSRLIESYRENFSSKPYLFTTSIWPSISGETPLQQYNACLSLKCLQEHTDGVFLF